MSDVVIRAEDLGKKYVIGHESKERYKALRDVIAQQGRRLLRSARDMAAGRALIAGDEREEFWALKDVNFEIKRGEVVGIIGRNGAGKSTLLKVLSRITEPTEGRVTIDGRVASLLEVGTGFHPELTGHENIYLNGAILGMSRAEIRRKFDEIVDFAGVEKFLDTPVKRYSSGMYVRLAFSVAAHLEPEILVVDEVLAVGDAEFQKKCLGKMDAVAKTGRTVLFVSHNIGLIRELSKTGILLEQGRTRFVGSIDAATSLYTARVSTTDRVQFQRQGLEISLSLKDDRAEYDKSEPVGLKVDVHSDKADPNLHVGYALYARGDDIPLWWSFHGDTKGQTGVSSGHTQFATRIPPFMLNDGNYEFELLIAEHGIGWIVPPHQKDQRLKLGISGGTFGSTLLTGTRRPSRLFPLLDWNETS